MNKDKTIIGIAFTGLALTACASAEPPTFTATDVTTAQATFASLAAMPTTSTGTMPSAGVANYTGNIGADLPPETSLTLM